MESWAGPGNEATVAVVPVAVVPLVVAVVAFWGPGIQIEISSAVVILSASILVACHDSIF